MSNGDAVTTEVGSSGGFSIEMDSSDGAVLERPGAGPVEFDTDDLKNTNEEDGGDGSEEELQDDAEGGDEDAGDGEPLEDLGEFNPEDASAFEERYFPNGEMSESTLSKEFYQNAENGNPGLNEGTYAFLESRGIPKGVAKSIEAAMMTQHDANANADAQNADFELFEAAGGPDALETALKWGKEGGYSKEDQKAFNEATKSKDAKKRKEAVELLMYRYGRANPAPKENPIPEVPKRDGTKGSGGRPKGAQPFANREEYRQAKRDAGDNAGQLRQVALRLAQSNF